MADDPSEVRSAAHWLQRECSALWLTLWCYFATCVAVTSGDLLSWFRALTLILAKISSVQFLNVQGQRQQGAAWFGHNDESQANATGTEWKFSSGFHLDSCSTLTVVLLSSEVVHLLVLRSPSESSCLIISQPGNLSSDTCLLSYSCLFMTSLDKSRRRTFQNKLLKRSTD